ncbi:MAG: type 4a pilus biogenesis protein PilO [Candidatus Omnitrophica bacterium]|nr:type 4a pilus biogenesis protein PilO [Candidatus Omnitrophota bacterium]
MKLDLTKFDINDIRTVKWIALAFFVTVLILDAFLFLSLVHRIKQAEIQKGKDAASLVFFKDLISKKDKFTSVQIIPGDKVDDLLDEIQKIAEKNNLTIKISDSLTADKNNENSSVYLRKDFSVEASGSFRDLGNFLTTLRHMSGAVLDIGGIRLSGDQSDASQVHSQISFVVLTT